MDEEEDDDDDLSITHHAAKRIRERLGIPKRSVGRTAKLVLKEGVSYTEVSGRLRRYMENIHRRTIDKGKPNARVLSYGDKIYVFAGETLITIWNVPKKVMFRGPKNNDQVEAFETEEE